MAYLIFAAVLAAISIGLIYLRSRPTDDPMKTVDSFRRAMKALDQKPRKKKKRS